MRILLYIFFLSLSCYSCGISSNKYTCKSLEDILISFIDSNEKFDVYSIYLSRIDGVDYINISTSNHYQKNFTDGYFFLKGKLITYYATDSLDRKEVIHYSNTNKFNNGDTIVGYKGSFEGNIEVKSKSFLILSKDSIIPTDNLQISRDTKQIAGSNGINNKIINRILNNYIKQIPSVLYEVNFFNRSNKHYISIRYAFYYDRRYIDAYFYRDGYLVVLYNVERMHGIDLIKEDEVKCFRGFIPNYKEGPILYWNLPEPKVFEIISVDSIKAVDNTEDIFFITSSG